MATAVLDQASAAQEIQALPLKQIRPAADNPRASVGDVAELAMSIKSIGVQQPIVVRPHDAELHGLDPEVVGYYEVVFGHRRLAAAQLAGLDEIPAIVRRYEEQDRLLAMAIENLQREDLTALEEARAYRRLLQELGCSQRDLAARVGRSQGHISKRLALLELPDDVAAQVDSGGITIADAVELAKLADQPNRIRAVLTGPTYYPIEARVDQELAEIEREKKIAAREEELESQAIATVRVGSKWNLPGGIHRLKGSDPNGYDPHGLQISVKDHEKHECHAIAIAKDGEEFAVCTDRTQHPKVRTLQEAEHSGGAGRAGTRKLSAAEKAAEKERDELEQAAAARLECIGRIAKGKVSKDDLVELSLYASFAFDFFAPFEWACRMLAVPLPAPIVEARDAETAEDAEAALADPYLDLEPEDAETALSVYAGESAANRLRASFAIAACAIEDHYLRSMWLGWKSAPVRALFNVLQRHGYKLSPAEKKKLAEKTA